MKTIIFILFSLLSLQAFAGDAVLLSSLKLKPKHVRYLESKFQAYLKDSGLKLVIHHDVDPRKLHEVLTSEETEALIWVSHAAKEKEQVPGRSAPAVIMDIHGNDVKNFFTMIPKNLKFLAIVGCQAEEIFTGFRERGNYDQHPNLEIMSFRKKVSMQGGLKKALKRLRYLLKAVQVPKTAPEVEQVEINLTRENFDSSPSIQGSWVEMGDRVLGIFSENELSVPTATIPKNVWDKIENKNIKHNRLQHAEAKDESFGKLSISTSEPDTWWKIFELRGRPLGGKNQHLYQYKK